MLLVLIATPLLTGCDIEIVISIIHEIVPNYICSQFNDSLDHSTQAKNVLIKLIVRCHLYARMHFDCQMIFMMF